MTFDINVNITARENGMPAAVDAAQSQPCSSPASTTQTVATEAWHRPVDAAAAVAFTKQKNKKPRAG